MKFNLMRVNIHGLPSINGNWWKWQVKCDCCGRILAREATIANAPPDFSEYDFCSPECRSKKEKERK